MVFSDTCIHLRDPVFIPKNSKDQYGVDHELGDKYAENSFIDDRVPFFWVLLPRPWLISDFVPLKEGVFHSVDGPVDEIAYHQSEWDQSSMDNKEHEPLIFGEAPEPGVNGSLGGRY